MTQASEHILDRLDTTAITSTSQFACCLDYLPDFCHRKGRLLPSRMFTAEVHPKFENVLFDAASRGVGDWSGGGGGVLIS